MISFIRIWINLNNFKKQYAKPTANIFYVRHKIFDFILFTWLYLSMCSNRIEHFLIIMRMLVLPPTHSLPMTYKTQNILYISYILDGIKYSHSDLTVVYVLKLNLSLRYDRKLLTCCKCTMCFTALNRLNNYCDAGAERWARQNPCYAEDVAPVSFLSYSEICLSF